MHLYIGWDVGCVGRSVRRFGQIGLVHRGCHAENRFLFRRCPGRSERQIGRKSSRQRTGHSDLRHQIPVGHGQISYQAGIAGIVRDIVPLVIHTTQTV